MARARSPPSQVANLLHEVIVLVVQLNVSATDLLLVQLLLGSLSGIEVVEDDQGGTTSLTSGLLDVDIALLDVVVCEELADVGLVDPVGQASHDQGSVLVHRADVLAQLARHAVIVVVGRPVEVQVVAIGDDNGLDVPVPDVLLVQLLSSSLGLLVVVEQDGSEAVLSALGVRSQDGTLLNVLVVLEERSDLFVPGAVRHSLDFNSHSILVLNYWNMEMVR